MDVVERWARHLRATGRQPNTIAAYRCDMERLRSFLDGGDLGSVTSDDLRAFLACERADGLQDATVIRRFRSLKQFYGWLARRREIAVDPTAVLSVPSADRMPDVLDARELASLLGACADERSRRRSATAGVFEARRDTAMVALFMTTGMTASEMVGLDVAAVDLAAPAVTVVGRRDRLRAVPLLRHVREVFEKYLVLRDGHPAASDTSFVWVGERGALTRSGVAQMLERRSQRAGIRCVRPGDFRRTFAHEALGRGMDRDEVAALGGWGSAAQVASYRPQ